jgi:hypothetical protein
MEIEKIEVALFVSEFTCPTSPTTREYNVVYGASHFPFKMHKVQICSLAFRLIYIYYYMIVIDRECCFYTIIYMIKWLSKRQNREIPYRL